MKKRRGLLLSLRLQGLGFRPADAEALVALWEAGHSVDDLVEHAVRRGYDVPDGLENVLSDLPRRSDPPD